MPGGIEGRGCTCQFEKLPDSDAPLLLSASQLEDLGAENYTVQKKVTFRRLSDQPVEIETSAKGHMMIDITKFPSRRPPRPTVRAKDEWCITVYSEAGTYFLKTLCAHRRGR